MYDPRLAEVRLEVVQLQEIASKVISGTFSEGEPYGDRWRFLSPQVHVAHAYTHLTDHIYTVEHGQEKLTDEHLRHALMRIVMAMFVKGGLEVERP